MKIGVLALQGAVIEHMRFIEKLGIEAVAVKKVEQLDELSGLIIPGGESTTIGKFIRLYGFQERLMALAEQGFPIMGTCAGLIVIAKHIIGQEQPHLPLMDIDVQRNAFGRQRESFETDLTIEGISEDFRAVFIRAPLIEKIGNEVECLAKHNDRIVAAKQGHFLAASFHPELTEDTRFHELFVDMVKQYVESKAPQLS